MSCSCGGKAVINLRYAGKRLCKTCFIRLFEKRVKKTIRELYPVKRGDRLIVGLSGGKDSTVVLHMMAKLPLPPREIIAITIDEGIEGYRDKGLEAAKNIAKEYGVEHKVFRYKNEVGMSLDKIMEFSKEPACSHCGVLRRTLLNKAVKELGGDLLVTGHNLDDAVQSCFMNLIRNEPSKIASFIKQKETKGFVKRIKPLVSSPEKEVALYAMLHNMPIDSEECPYARFSLRAHVRKMINELEEKYPGTKFKIFQSMLNIKSEDDREFKLCEHCGSPSSGKICMFCKRKKQYKRYLTPQN